MKKTIGIFAHVDAGKTTLSETILFLCKKIRTPGSVDRGDTVMDSSAIERRRGITVFSDVAQFEYNGNEYYLIDTPGHTDFLPDTERCMASLDCAVLVVSGVDGVENTTEALWKLFEEKNIPVFIFINKCDRPTADVSAVMKQIQKRLSPHAVLYASSDFTEKVCEGDDTLLERYLSGLVIDDFMLKECAASLVAGRKMFICSTGSAAENTGVDTLLYCMDNFLCVNYDPKAELSCRAFRVRRDKNDRVVFVKLTSGSLCVRDTLPTGERVSQLRLYNGKKWTPCERAQAGDIVGVLGPHSLKAGDSIGCSALETRSVAYLCSSVTYPEDICEADMMAKLKILEDEEPSMRFEAVAEKGISVSVMGSIQLEVLKEEIKNRFGIECGFGPLQVVYKETIVGTTVGYGHYEPLRHYSEAVLQIEEAPRGSGITFESKCPLDMLSSNYQNLIRTHVFEKKHKGVLAGGELTDVKITLLRGAAHEKHTEGGDFRQAVYRGIRQGLMKAKSLLLEPWYRCEFYCEPSLSGRVISDVNRMCGELLESESKGELSRVCALVPTSRVIEYQREFVSFTRGRGRLVLFDAGYRECHNTNEVIEALGYDPTADLENSPDSIFCAKGAGFHVKWDEVENYAHCR